MTFPERSTSNDAFMKRTVEAAIRIGVIAGLIAWCFLIARPFLVPIVWGAIIAVAVFHGYEGLKVIVGGRRVTAAVLITLLMLVLLVVPSILLGELLVSGARNLSTFFRRESFKYHRPRKASVAGRSLASHRQSLDPPSPKTSKRRCAKSVRCLRALGFGFSLPLRAPDLRSCNSCYGS